MLGSSFWWPPKGWGIAPQISSSLDKVPQEIRFGHALAKLTWTSGLVRRLHFLISNPRRAAQGGSSKQEFPQEQTPPEE